MSRELALRVDNVSGGYGEMTIVRQLSADVVRGGCLCVLGRNGVGKSTLARILSGHLACQEGSIFLNGREVTRVSTDQRRRLGLSCAMQERPVFDSLSVRDNLLLMRPRSWRVPYEPYLESFPVLQERLTQAAGTLSGGERKILSFVRTMAENGEVTVLDEPSEGVQSENVEKMKNLVLARKSSGASFVIVEQNLDFADAVADAFLVMDQGRSVLQGVASEIGRESVLEHLEP